jgi:glutathione S-transferase
MANPMRVYGDMNSGNCLKVRYVADRLDLPYEWVEVDIMKGESRTDAFLALSPMGQVPLVVLDDGRPLAQSNAIMRFLAEGSDLIPADAYLRAKMDELLFWEQNLHEPFVAGCIFQMVYLGKSADERDPERVARAEKALDLMERLAAGRLWFVGDSMTLADIALLAYTRRAPMGGFHLAGRPAVTEWIARCERALGLAPLGIAA